MRPKLQRPRLTLGVLAGWQFYRTATNLSYLKPVYAGIARAAHDLGCNVLLGCGLGASASLADPVRPAWPVPEPGVDYLPISAENADGLIVCNPLQSEAQANYVQALRQAGYPVLFVGSGQPGPTLMADNTQGVFAAMAHLVQHGHQHIAFLAGSPNDLQGDTGERIQAYREALQSFRLVFDERRFVYGFHIHSGGYAGMRQILNSGVPCTAVLASNDEMALGALQALAEAGRRVPRDMALIGFDNRPEGAVHQPGLTSVHVPLFNMGYWAAETLLQHLRGQADLPTVLRVQTRLVVRASCGCSALALDEPSRLPLTSPAETRPSLTATITTRVLNQAQSLTEIEGQALCQQLVEAFKHSCATTHAAAFEQVLERCLRRTQSSDDDAHIWQEAITLLESEAHALTAPAFVNTLLNQARLTISAAMQQQHRQRDMEQRWASSRLSLLTAGLLAALDETRILETLAQHLPEMDIHTALLALFDPDSSRLAVYDVLTPTVQAIHLPSATFPAGLSSLEDQPFRWTLIPLLAQTGQVGLMVFDTGHFDLYGAIVQQVGGALNTARLYRQATEGRRLAEEANRLKSRFLSTVSHELRTPLNVIVGLSALLLEAKDSTAPALPSAYRQDIARIQSSGQHLGWLIRDVLDLASNEAGQLRLSNEFVDLADILRLPLDMGQQLAHEKGLGWQVTLPDHPLWVWGDRTRLRQVALNLLHNAVKFTTQGEVSLSLTQENDWAVVRVSDTGLGIAPAEQQAIFQEFRRTDLANARGYGGLGLGLAICKLLVEMHGGLIEVQSTGEEGRGSTFTFRLPVVEVARLGAPSANNTEQTVLVVVQQASEAEAVLARLQARGLAALALHLDTTPNWLEALLQAAPDVVALDVNLPPALGWDIFRTLKNHPLTQTVSVFFLSLTGQHGGALELDYLLKPLEAHHMTRVLRQHGLEAEDTVAKTVLVVDDDTATLELHARLVTTRLTACRVVTARNGWEALERLASDKPDLVLLDLVMPGLDGFSVLDKMRHNPNTRDIPVVVITGQTLTESEMARLSQGVTTVLEKELFSMDETLSHLEAALLRRRKLGGETQRLVRRAMAYIHEHFAEPLTREDLARHVGMSDDYLTASFRKELGMTPVAYITRCRINQAKHLLRTTTQSVTEIGLAVGFSDSSYFSRVFRRETGQSPEMWRRG